MTGFSVAVRTGAGFGFASTAFLATCLFGAALVTGFFATTLAAGRDLPREFATAALTSASFGRFTGAGLIGATGAWVTTAAGAVRALSWLPATGPSVGSLRPSFNIVPTQASLATSLLWTAAVSTTCNSRRGAGATAAILAIAASSKSIADRISTPPGTFLLPRITASGPCSCLTSCSASRMVGANVRLILITSPHFTTCQGFGATNAGDDP